MNDPFSCNFLDPSSWLEYCTFPELDPNGKIEIQKTSILFCTESMQEPKNSEAKKNTPPCWDPSYDDQILTQSQVSRICRVSKEIIQNARKKKLLNYKLTKNKRILFKGKDVKLYFENYHGKDKKHFKRKEILDRFGFTISTFLKICGSKKISSIKGFYNIEDFTFLTPHLKK